MSLVKHIWKKLSKWIWVPLTKYYLSKDRELKIGDINLIIPVGVFHPTLFLSTKLLGDYLNKQAVNNLTILELGAGSGFLSITMAKRGALLTASDISQKACATVKENALNNGVFVDIIHSDLFDNFNKKLFDLIIINPPYYPKNPQTEADKAWYCGVDYNYFRKLFAQLANYIERQGKAIMVLSDDCNIELIRDLAIINGFTWREIARKKYRYEWNYLFSITL
ncbi:methyltransferase [Spirosoma sp. HMF3257]|uniref:Methyltransferase n=1 Tax=Spirosoma telluris TaxID=2183553 RepID=A0A327NS04_9BACT|nr:methyltransferase [Spirosoma telluris]RAI78042.1 methyltransferase [Spirosoma telluris]